MNIVNITAWDGVLSADPFPLNGPTASGNALIVALSLDDQGGLFASITTDAGDSVPGLPFATDTNAAFNINGSELTTAIFWIPVGIGGATTMTIVASGSFSVWVYEVQSAGLTLDAAAFNDSTASGDNTIVTGPLLHGTGTSELYVACMTTGPIVSVAGPWTLDPTAIRTFEFDFGGAHLLGTGDQTPVFTQAPSNKWSVSGVAFKEATSSIAIPVTLVVTAPTAQLAIPVTLTVHGCIPPSDGRNFLYIKSLGPVSNGNLWTLALDSAGTLWTQGVISGN